MKAIVHHGTNDADELGPDLLRGVKAVDLVSLTPNMVRALLILLNRVGGKADTTLRGELQTAHYRLLNALGVPQSFDPAADPKAARYLGRDDLVDGYLHFLKGGAHV